MKTPYSTLTWSFVKRVEMETLPSALKGFQGHLVIGTTGCQREERSWRRPSEKFHGPDLEVVGITFTHITEARTQLHGHN